MDWTPAKYTQGNYFQIETNERFRKSLDVQPFGNILDVGCGDGQYTRLLAEQTKKGQILGIDHSAEMIKHANRHWASKNLSFEVHPIERFQSHTQFDFVLSFWCLHWTNINLSLPAIYNALKNGGRIYALFSSCSNNSITQLCSELAKKNHHKMATEKYINLNQKHSNYFYRVLNALSLLPFKQVKLKLETTHVYFPDISYFKNLLLTMPFLKKFSTMLIEDLVEEFQNRCQREYDGKLYYETRPIYLEAIK